MLENTKATDRIVAETNLIALSATSLGTMSIGTPLAPSCTGGTGSAASILCSLPGAAAAATSRGVAVPRLALRGW